jgi:hypothetical protein
MTSCAASIASSAGPAPPRKEASSASNAAAPWAGDTAVFVAGEVTVGFFRGFLDGGMAANLTEDDRCSREC